MERDLLTHVKRHTGDAKVTAIAAASIIAKVTRDRIMQELDKEYPQYLFAQHKGYLLCVCVCVCVCNTKGLIACVPS